MPVRAGALLDLAWHRIDHDACRARQVDRDGGALAERAGDLHGAAGLMREAVHLRQSKAGALADRLRGEERVEHIGDDVRRDADAVVADGDGDILAGGNGLALAKSDVLRRDRHRAAVGQGIAGIDHEVDQGDFQFADVDGDRPYTGWDIDRQPDIAAKPAGENFADRIDPLRDLDRLRIDPLPPRECQQLPRQGGAALSGELDRLCGARGFRILCGDRLQRLDVARHHHEQVVEVMRHAAGELAERVHLLRFGKLPLNSGKLHLRLAALGDIAGDLGVADQLAGFIANRIDHHAGPEERTILADAPAFLFIAAGLACNRQRPCRAAGGLILVGVEAREMLADDFRRRVAFDPFAAGVPARHESLRIEHVQRVVCDTADQEPEVALAVQQRIPQPSPAP